MSTAGRHKELGADVAASCRTNLGRGGADLPWLGTVDLALRRAALVARPAARRLLLAWHGSLQHEAVHGQLAPWRWLNDAIALPPLGLWLPFPIYRATHRAHHDFAILTEPWRDPKSFYVDQATWRRLRRPVRAVLWVHNTMLGRLLLGPALVIGQFYWAELRALQRGDRRNLGIWAWHLPLATLVLLWVLVV